MKSILRAAIFIIGLVLSNNIICQAQTAGSDSLSLLLNNSKIENKKLFLIFGWEGCGWCRVFDKYHNDPKVKEILNRYYIITKIDIYKTKAGEDLYKSYGKEGTPSWTILDSNGKILTDSDNGKGNIGYPVTEDELKYYLSAIKKTAPNINQSDCEFLISKLKAYKEKK